MFTANWGTTNFFACPEIKKIAKYFSYEGRPLYHTITIKKSKKDYNHSFRPLMQRPYVDIEKGIRRTFDIIVPIQGGFKENPLEAIDTKDGSHHILKPLGKAFLVPCDLSWHFSWHERVYDFRYTLHFRGQMPITYEFIKEKYSMTEEQLVEFRKNAQS